VLQNTWQSVTVCDPVRDEDWVDEDFESDELGFESDWLGSESDWLGSGPFEPLSFPESFTGSQLPAIWMPKTFMQGR
jgi:hypothetical protein